LIVWLEFLTVFLVIAAGGFGLSRYGEVIAERTGLTGGWVGLVLLASVTSLPELTTGLSSVTLAHAPNIAVGDALGSCMFNLLILAVIDLLYRKAPVFTRASHGHILSANFSTLLLGLVGLSILLPTGADKLAIGHVGGVTLVIGLVYLLALRLVYTYDQRLSLDPPDEISAAFPRITLKTAIWGYAACSAVVIAAGLLLPAIAVQMAHAMGWSNSFVGTLFVAAATSVPELAVTIFAVRFGALNMAVGNLLGSNLFNMVVLAVDDVAFVKGPLLSNVSNVHAATVLSVLVMNGIASVALVYRPTRRFLKTASWASLGLVAVYLMTTWLIFLHGE
jgi:cation:H+ antiporter